MARPLCGAFTAPWTSWPHTKHSPRRTLPRACVTHQIGTASQETARWARSIVVGLGLCPFAASALDSGGVRVREFPGTTELDASVALRSEIAHLLAQDEGQLTTTLVVLPEFAQDDFLRWHMFTEGMEKDVENDATLVDKVMLACFHPMHTWGGVDKDDAVHFDRRAPHPTINILRAEQVDDAVSEGKTEGILERNQDTLQDIGYDGMEKLYRALKK